MILAYAGLEGTVSRTRRWRCRCDCGTITIVTWKQLQANTTRSCGCLNRERLAQAGGWNALPAGESAFNQFFGAYRGSARRRGYTFTLDADAFRALTESECYYCGAPPEPKYRGVKGTNGHHVGNGVDRIDNAIGYEPGNVVACCKQCNIAKGVLGQSEFIEWAKRVAVRFE